MIVLIVWRGARRDRGWSVATESLGLRYTDRDNTPLDVFTGFKIFDAIGVRSLVNVATGTRSNVRVWLADYRYNHELVSAMERYGFTVCMLQCGHLKVPHFRLYSRSAPRSLTMTPTVSRPEDDPEIPLDGELARMFTLQTRLGDNLRPFLHQGFRERITAIWKPYIEIEGIDDRLVVTRRSWIKPTDLRQLLDHALSILDELSRAKWA